MDRSAANPNAGMAPYGYLLVRDLMSSMYSARGMLGQTIAVFPDHDMVVVITASNEDLYDQWEYITEYVSFELLKENRKANQTLADLLEEIKY